MPSLEEYLELFGLDGDRDILDESHFAIVNGHITTNVLKSNALSLRTLFAPPFASSNFLLEGRIFGELVKTREYQWQPCEVLRKGAVQGIEVATSLTLIEGQRAMILEIQLRNTSAKAVRVPIQFEVSGGMDYVTEWLFLRPKADKLTRADDQKQILRRVNDTGEIVVGCSLSPMAWEDFASHWLTEIHLKPGESRDVHVVVAIGAVSLTGKIARELLLHPKKAIAKSQHAWRRRALDLLNKVPRFSSSDKRLQQFYYRSVLHFLLNQWRVPEFVLNPFYTTGSVIGGCVCSYLWDFGEGWEIFPLYDPLAMRKHIKAFLNIDLTRHFTFNPLSGAAWGPWYQINQEKVVFLIYYYVVFSGDTEFLAERVNGRRVIEHVVEHAMFGDRMEKEANLIDYGNGNHHLELRREYRYDNYMPDLNGRRCATYIAAEKLCKMAGLRSHDFRERAEKLKRKIHKEMWSEKDKWWFFIDPQGKKELRYTMQMFKLIGTGAISEKEERALVGHINTKEFLSDYGMHSMAKIDPAYDQVDIDNGGGGAYTGFPPQIIEKLYKAGYPEQAEAILGRILWWGERLPYWGDSLVANAIDYRKDTPLQNTIGSVARAQALIFGMFGVQVKGDALIVHPAPPTFSPEISLEGLSICGLKIDIHASGTAYEVVANGTRYTMSIGTSLKLPIRPPAKGLESATRKRGDRRAARGRRVRQ